MKEKKIYTMQVGYEVIAPAPRFEVVAESQEEAELMLTQWRTFMSAEHSPRVQVHLELINTRNFVDDGSRKHITDIENGYGNKLQGVIGLSGSHE